MVPFAVTNTAFLGVEFAVIFSTFALSRRRGTLRRRNRERAKSACGGRIEREVRLIAHFME
jgi:hypothetical protein